MRGEDCPTRVDASGDASHRLILQRCAESFDVERCQCFAWSIREAVGNRTYQEFVGAMITQPDLDIDDERITRVFRGRNETQCGVVSDICNIAVCEEACNCNDPIEVPEPPAFPQDPRRIYEKVIFDEALQQSRRYACFRDENAIDRGRPRDGEIDPHGYLNLDPGEYCVPRESAAQLFSEGARYWLLRGDAELASREAECAEHELLPDDSLCRRFAEAAQIQPGREDSELVYWRSAVDWGVAFGAQASILAQRRVQAHTVQCPMSAQSLALISRRDAVRSLTTEAISLRMRQAALKALGYYSGPVDGAYGPDTRLAVRGLQRELGYDETGSLTPRQTTQLVCHAAQTARDPAMQNVLGIMHMMGLGVEQNIDLGMEWLDTAASRGDADANYNLALIHGTGAVFASYRLCAIPQSPERADAYLREAAQLGHSIASNLRGMPRLRGGSAERRWSIIKDEIIDSVAEQDPDGILQEAVKEIEDLIPPVDQSCLEAYYIDREVFYRTVDSSSRAGE